MSRFKGLKGTILLIIMILLVVALYFHASNASFKASLKKDKEEGLTAVQEVLLRNLEKNYPPSPKEVVKYYSSIVQCFYGGEYTETELYDLAMKAQGMYDDELVANKSSEQYMQDLKDDIAKFKENNRVVSSFSTSASTDVVYFTQDGYEWAKLYCIYSIREGTAYTSLEQAFLLRKDENSHWKIYGFKATDE